MAICEIGGLLLRHFSKIIRRFQWYLVVKSHKGFVKCKRDEVYFTTPLWQNSGQQNDLRSLMLFSEI